ncbi:hypothetical protein [Sagittula stellata]|uniref:Uncharacterized protein n=1 Tax=Sagittula stellata (strain ATCC 700073 / DSM 11524 / E-37) TaxID=388399 RepID=A3K6N9_SAGS3|nr:hypothetical protein [Sagittula stellata]EBA07016.1 hypothetical protein SSE37_12501 [Sagittula stellata E-37]
MRFGKADDVVSMSCSSTFNAVVKDFEAGDTFQFTDLNAGGPVRLSFTCSGNSGQLVLDVGGQTDSLSLFTGSGSFTGVTDADFSVTTSVSGGIEVETSLDFLV